MISEERLTESQIKEIIYRTEMFGHGAGYSPDEVISMAREVLAHRKSWSEPAGAIPADDIQWLNRGGKAEISIHWINSDGSLPLYRKPSTN